MKASKHIVAALAALMTLMGCEQLPIIVTPGNGDQSFENLTKEYTIRQRRSTKRGVCSHVQIETDITLLAPGVAWSYNWGAKVSFPGVMRSSNMLYMPMAWNANFNAEQMRDYKNSFPEAEYILAYNEPNLTDQANMTPAVAASHWGALKAVADELGMKLISPAVNYGTLAGYHDPIVWLDEFFAQDGVSLDDVAGIAVHCYMPSGEGLKSFMRRFDKYNKPLFLTEFCHAGSGITNNATTQQAFMADVLNYLEADDKVGGYAWFMARGSGDWKAISLLNASAKEPALTDLGSAYVYFSSFDKECYYPTGEAFPAAHFRSNNGEAGAEGGAWEKCPGIKASSDATGPVVLCDFFSTQMWVEYGIEVKESGTYDLLVRYANLVDGTFTFTIDGSEVSHTFPTTASEDTWKTAKVEGFDLSEGKHILRVALTKGRANFNWMCFEKR